MSSFLQWFTENNKFIIQLLVISISLILVYFVYRIFFVKQVIQEVVEKAAPANQAFVQVPVSHKTVDQAAALEATLKIENELNAQKLSELQALLNERSVQVTAKDEQLNTLKQQLNAKSSNIDSTSSSGDADLAAQIDELQKKLKEYDIISDDIAELQDLRKENSALKSQIESKPAQ